MNRFMQIQTQKNESSVKELVREDLILDRQSFQKLINENDKILIFKFGATWCGPCNQMLPQLNHWIRQLPSDKFRFIAVDVDKSMDLFSFLKTKKITSSVPTLLCYIPENKNFYPDYITIGNDINKVNDFFMFAGNN